MKHWRGFLIAIPIVVALLSSCQKEMPANIVAMVNDEPITVADFSAEFTPLIEGYHNPPTAQEKEDLQNLKKALLNQLIENKLVLIEAAKMGVTVSDDELEQAFTLIKGSYPQGGLSEIVRDETALRQWKEKLRQRLLIEKVINRVSQVTSAIDDDALRKYYKKHQAEFLVPEQVRVRQIVVKDQQEAQSLLRRLKQGASFEELAKKHSIGPEAEMGGDLGFFARGDMPEEFNVAFTLKAGETSEVVKSPYGYHIFQVVARRGETESSFDEAKDQIRKMVVQEEEGKIFQAWLKKAKKKARVSVNNRALEEIAITAPPEGQQ
jgi:parvulin-like peptidyl-prolyl isomerase